MYVYLFIVTVGPTSFYCCCCCCCFSFIITFSYWWWRHFIRSVLFLLYTKPTLFLYSTCL